MGRGKKKEESVVPRVPVTWTSDMEAELYRTVAHVLKITDGSMNTKAVKHQRVAQLLTKYCIEELGMNQFKDNPLDEDHITDKMDSVKKKINKLFKDGAYQKKGETGREATDADIIDIDAVQAKWVCVGAYIEAFKDLYHCIVWSPNLGRICIHADADHHR